MPVEPLQFSEKPHALPLFNVFSFRTLFFSHFFLPPPSLWTNTCCWPRLCLIVEWRLSHKMSTLTPTPTATPSLTPSPDPFYLNVHTHNTSVSNSQFARERNALPFPIIRGVGQRRMVMSVAEQRQVRTDPHTTRSHMKMSIIILPVTLLVHRGILGGQF